MLTRSRRRGRRHRPLYGVQWFADDDTGFGVECERVVGFVGCAADSGAGPVFEFAAGLRWRCAEGREGSEREAAGEEDGEGGVDLRGEGVGDGREGWVGGG